MTPPEFPTHDSDFDLRTRAALALAFEPGEAPPHLLRHTPWSHRRGVHWCLAGLMVAAVTAGALFALRPPELVREAIDHEYYERTLRGSFMEVEPLLAQLGLTGNKSVPGFPQLMRPCDIDGHLVYHLTTFFERGGMVTVFAFDQPVDLKEGSGWWGNVHWQVTMSRQGKPLVLVAQQKRALSVAAASLLRDPA
jgi:hypothetical protein